MNYQLHYATLIERANNRKLAGYVELHHILPRCLGGGDEQSNLVALTAEEHYTAHLLLAKIHRAESKLIFAALMMTVSNGVHGRSRNKVYGWVRRLAAKASSLRQVSIEQREAQSKRQTGMKRSEESCKNISIALKGRVMSPEWKANISKGKKGKPSPLIGRELSEETRAKISATLKAKPIESRIFGRTHSIESKAKIGAASKARICSGVTREKLRVASTGRTCADETRAKISAIHSGKVVSNETRAKISEAHRGMQASAETREKMRLAHLGRADTCSPEQRRAAALKAWETKRENQLAV